MLSVKRTSSPGRSSRDARRSSSGQRVGGSNHEKKLGVSAVTRRRRLRRGAQRMNEVVGEDSSTKRYVALAVHDSAFAVPCFPHNEESTDGQLHHHVLLYSPKQRQDARGLPLSSRSDHCAQYGLDLPYKCPTTTLQQSASFTDSSDGICGEFYRNLTARLHDPHYGIVGLVDSSSKASMR